MRIQDRAHRLAWACIAAAAVSACGGGSDSSTPTPAVDVTAFTTATLSDWPAITSGIARETSVETQVSALLASLSLEEKVGQMTQVEIQNVTPEEIITYHLGSVLNGGGSFPGQNKGAAVADWRALADQLWEASMSPRNAHPIPLIWGTDAVHGHNNVKGATLFPHNIGLGAARDPELMRRMGEVTAREVARSGIDWAFAPTLAVVRDDRWGRTYEGFSEDPLIAQTYGGQIVLGLQGALGKDPKSNEKVIATAKHFIGDGGTTSGTDQGITVATEQALINLHARGYYTALQAGAQTVMASYSSWQNSAQGEGARATKMHGNGYLLTDVLKTKMGFDGFVVSDWNGIGQVKPGNSDAAADCTNANCPQAINAGVDMVMVPYRDDWKAFIANTIASVRSGEIAQSRIDDAVRRILRVKVRAGLFSKPKPSARNASDAVGTDEHRAVAREAVRKSLVLLKNNGAALPLARTAKLLVAGKSADSLSNQTGGWSLTWQGTSNTNADFGGGTTLWQAVQKIAPNAVLDTSANGALGSAEFDAAIVVIGETPYAEGVGDLGRTKTLELAKLQPADIALIQALKAKGVKKIITVLYSGRPLYANREINASDALVAAWLPGTEGDGLADVLFRAANGAVNFDFQGTLSYSWPKSACQVALNYGDAGYDPLYAYGYGLRYAAPGTDQAAYDETSASQGCGMPADGGGGTATQALSAFDGTNQNGFIARLGAPSNWNVPISLSTASSTTSAAGEITATPIDDRNGKQWAALRVKWNDAAGQVYLQTDGDAKQDLRSYLNAPSGALVFDAKVYTAPAASVKMRVDCGYPCIGEIDVTEVFKTQAVGSWKQLAVPLSCFSTRGTDFMLINTPFLLYTTAGFELGVANVRWEPNATPNVPCESGAGPTILSITADKDLYVNGISDASALATPGSWSYGNGSLQLNAAASDGAGGTVIDVQYHGVTDGGGNGGIFLSVPDNTFIDASAVAATGGVEFEIRVLDYGNTTQDFWVKLVCNRNADNCRTGDLTNLVGHPAVGTWATVKIPFSAAGYAANGFDPSKLSSVLEMLPAWNDQLGEIHFQLRNVRIRKVL
ncbi:MAG: 1,4-beta-D-glucan glucohydrolase [Pseudomonadota bacterium]|jgi:beta-glucosidase